MGRLESKTLNPQKLILQTEGVHKLMKNRNQSRCSLMQKIGIAQKSDSKGV